MDKLNITKGEWEVINYQKDLEVGTLQSTLICSLPINNEECANNALLIVDAGNTIQKCNRMPSELLEERNELIEWIQEILKHTDEMPFKLNQSFYEANELINKISK